jgi:hypothetical protein
MVRPRLPRLSHPAVPALALALLGAAPCSCAVFGISLDRTKAPDAGGRYAGPECEGIELDDEVDFVRTAGAEKRVVRMFSPQPARVDALALRVAKVTCGDALASYPPDGGADAYVQYHHDFDARRFDHATAALILAMCNKSSACIGPLGPNSTQDADATHYPAGQLAYYAEQVDPEAVDAALASAGVGTALRAHFLVELDAARTEVRRIVAEIPKVAAGILVDLPREVWTKRAAEAAEHTELYAGFDALAQQAHAQREGGVDDATVAALQDLRAAWVDACGELACMDRGLGVEVARALFFAHVSRGDGLAAQAELGLVDPEVPIEAAVSIALRQRDAMSAATEAHRKQASMRDQGLDEATARGATGGAVSHDFSSTYAWDLEKVRRVQWASLVPGGGEPRRHGGKLRAKRAKGGLVILEFADEVERYADEACSDTHRVERIESDGRLVYQQRCRKTGKTNVYRQSFEPVVVPAREAKGLQVGDVVTTVVAPGTPMPGRVVSASRKDRLVQRRDVRH